MYISVQICMYVIKLKVRELPSFVKYCVIFTLLCRKCVCCSSFNDFRLLAHMRMQMVAVNVRDNYTYEQLMRANKSRVAVQCAYQRITSDLPPASMHIKWGSFELRLLRTTSTYFEVRGVFRQTQNMKTKTSQSKFVCFQIYLKF